MILFPINRLTGSSRPSKLLNRPTPRIGAFTNSFIAAASIAPKAELPLTYDYAHYRWMGKALHCFTNIHSEMNRQDFQIARATARSPSQEAMAMRRDLGEDAIAGRNIRERPLRLLDSMCAAIEFRWLQATPPAELRHSPKTLPLLSLVLHRWIVTIAGHMSSKNDNAM